MASVRVEQRNAYLAGAVRLEYMTHRDRQLAKAVLTAISNVRCGGAVRGEVRTVVQWTLWGALAESANTYLGKGAHVNIVGHLRNHHYQDKQGADRYGFSFVVDEVDFLDGRSKVDERRQAQLTAEGWGESSLEPPARRRAANAPGSAPR